MLKSQEKTLILYVYNDLTSVHLALIRDGLLVERVSLSSRQFNTHFFPLLDEIFIHQACKLDDCTAFAVSAGPAPFTTLRSILATINTFAWMLQKPVYAVHGLYANIFGAIDTGKPQKGDLICTCVHAFCGDMYYAYVLYDGLQDNIADATVEMCALVSFEKEFCRITQHVQNIWVCGNAFGIEEDLVVLQKVLADKRVCYLDVEKSCLEMVVKIIEGSSEPLVIKTNQAEPLYIKPPFCAM